jgi:hypothetical protein
MTAAVWPKPDVTAMACASGAIATCLLIRRRDQFGFGRNTRGTIDDIPYLEALWSPYGAECLNVGNRRRRDMAITNTRGVPECTPVQWTRERKLAPGPVERPAD